MKHPSSGQNTQHVATTKLVQHNLSGVIKEQNFASSLDWSRLKDLGFFLGRFPTVECVPTIFRLSYEDMYVTEGSVGVKFDV